MPKAAFWIAVLVSLSLHLVEGAGSPKPVDVLLVGGRIPDEAFLHYDPALEYKVLAYPSWAEPGVLSLEDASRWLRAQGEEGRPTGHEFIIELPFGVPGFEYLYPSSCIRQSIYTMGASLLLPVPQTRLLSDLSPDDTRTEPGEGELSRQNREILRGKLRDDYSVRLGQDPSLQEFSDLVGGYRDVNLFLMEGLHPAAEEMARVHVSGAVVGGTENEWPWLVRIKLSDLPGGPGGPGDRDPAGYAWKCASPLTGVFYFPGGGFVATSFLSDKMPYSITSRRLAEEHEYAWDIISHIVLFSRGIEIPSLLPAHEARRMFGDHWRLHREAYRSLDLAELFSSEADTYRIWVALAETYGARRGAEATYLEGDVEGSCETMRGELIRVQSASARAERILKLSLLWIHAIEWIVVAATFMVAFSATIHFVRRPRITTVGTTRYRPVEPVPTMTRRAARKGVSLGGRTVGVVVVVTSCVALLVLLTTLAWSPAKGDYEFTGTLALSSSPEGPGEVGISYGVYPVSITVHDGKGEMVVHAPMETGTQSPLMAGDSFAVSGLRIKDGCLSMAIEGSRIRLDWTSQPGLEYLARNGRELPPGQKAGRIRGDCLGLPGYSIELSINRQ